MGILSGIFRARDKPVKNSLTGSVFSPWLGGSSSGRIVTERSAMQMTAVYACVRILSEAIAGLPLIVYRYGEAGSKEKATEHSLFRILHDEPNPEMTSFIWRETAMTHMLLWGNSYSQIIRDRRGEIISLYPLMPNRMKVDRDTNGKLYYEYQMQSDDGASVKQGTVRLDPRDVLHVPALGFDGLVGYSPIAMAKNAIGLSMAAEEYGAKFFAEGGTPKGILTMPNLIKNFEKARQTWREGFSASGSNVALLEKGTEYQAISINPQDAQFLETRKFQVDEICRIFRVPPHMVGDLEKSSFSNIEQQSLEFVKYTLNPWVSRWEQSMNRALFTDKEKPKMFIKFNVDGLLRGDYKSRMEGYAIARQNGWMNMNEIRELENMDRVPAEEGGDAYLVNGNMIPVTRAMKGGEK